MHLFQELTDLKRRSEHVVATEGSREQRQRKTFARDKATHGRRRPYCSKPTRSQAGRLLKDFLGKAVSEGEGLHFGHVLRRHNLGVRPQERLGLVSSLT